MSIPLKNSPFQGQMLPCQHCVEYHDRIICEFHNDPICENPKRCNDYKEVDWKNFQNNCKKSLRPTWLRKEYDTYYVEECSRCGERVPKNQWNRDYYSRCCPRCGHKLYVEGEDVKDVEPGIYQHFKGRQYKVFGVAQNTETSDKYVVYQALYGQYKMYARPLEMFVEDIEDLERHYRGPRFFKVGEE